MEILKSLIQIRKEKRIDQRSIAEHLGVNRTSISRYENMTREIPYILIDKYAEYLGYEIRLLKK